MVSMEWEGLEFGSAFQTPEFLSFPLVQASKVLTWMVRQEEADNHPMLLAFVDQPLWKWTAAELFPSLQLKRDGKVIIVNGNAVDGENLTRHWLVFVSNWVYSHVTATNPKTTKDNKELNRLMRTYLETGANPEYEVRFQKINRTTYEQVARILFANGFTTHETYHLRVSCLSERGLRAEMDGIASIDAYHGHDDINLVPHRFTTKSEVIVPKKTEEKEEDKDGKEFDFTVSLQYEKAAEEAKVNALKQNWQDRLKYFRRIRRIGFHHPDFPFRVDLSIVLHSGPGDPSKRGLQKSMATSLAGAKETFEIEIEMLNRKVAGFVYMFQHDQLGSIVGPFCVRYLADQLRSGIRLVLMGIQNTKFPLPWKQRWTVMKNYLALTQPRTAELSEREEREKQLDRMRFLGPNSVTLQLNNLKTIQSNYCVTEKADGERRLLFVDGSKRIYMVTMAMEFIDTGAQVTDSRCVNALLDGEWITQTREGGALSLFLAFDLYHWSHVSLSSSKKEGNKEGKEGNKEVKEGNKEVYKYPFWGRVNSPCRYAWLQEWIEMAQCAPRSVPRSSGEEMESPRACPIEIRRKVFWPIVEMKSTLFDACRSAMHRRSQVEYETDGFIFTPMSFPLGASKDEEGVGEEEDEEEDKPVTVTRRFTWSVCFKWKPPEYNTIDFQVVTVKDPGRQGGSGTVDRVDWTDQGVQYKTLELHCKYSNVDKFTRNQPFENALESLVEFDWSNEKTERNERNEKNTFHHPGGGKKRSSTFSAKFIPTIAPLKGGLNGICYHPLEEDTCGVGQMMTEAGEVFRDGDIVEFKYVISSLSSSSALSSSSPCWGWKALRIRYDKQKRGESGNHYDTCNTNWKSILFPVTLDMLTNMEKEGEEEKENKEEEEVVDVDDQYYSYAGEKMSRDVNQFHNTVKRLLLHEVCRLKSPTGTKKTLIDFACGKAGDLQKWMSAGLKFVFGLDVSNNNITDAFDGACTRYLNHPRRYETRALFAQADCSHLLRHPSSHSQQKGKGGGGGGGGEKKERSLSQLIVDTVFSNQGGGVEKETENDRERKGLRQCAGWGERGFDVASCQFALHYFFRDLPSLLNFVRNVHECVTLGGYFVATCLDGESVYRRFLSQSVVCFIKHDHVMCKLEKKYSDDRPFLDMDTPVGFQIDVFQESIGQMIPEYLVHAGYFMQLMEKFGFRLANGTNMDHATHTFDCFFDRVDARHLLEVDRDLSRLNRYFIFQKTTHLKQDELNELITSLLKQKNARDKKAEEELHWEDEGRKKRKREEDLKKKEKRETAKANRDKKKVEEEDDFVFSAQPVLLNGRQQYVKASPPPPHPHE